MFTHLIVGSAQGFNVGDAVFFALCFLILMAIIGKIAWDPITKMLEERANKISNDIDSAEDSRNKAEKLAKERQDALNNSHAEASEIVSKATQDGKERRENIIFDAKSDASLLKENAQKDIEQERKDALASTKNDVADLSIEIASKIIKKELSAEDQKTLIDSYIKGLGD